MYTFVPDVSSVIFCFLLFIAKTQMMLLGVFCCFWGLGLVLLLFVFCLFFFFQNTILFPKSSLLPTAYSLLFMKLLSLVYDNFHSNQCNLRVLWLQVENKHHKFMQMSPVINKNRRQRNRKCHMWNRNVEKEYMSKFFFPVKYYCILLTTNTSVQHRKLPAEHNALNTHKSDCVADVKCKIH